MAKKVVTEGEKKPLRLIGFGRVSTKDQEDNTSLETQERDIRDYCRVRGYELVDMVAEPETGFGDLSQRPKFSAVVNRLHQGEADGLIVWKLDRYTRHAHRGIELFAWFQDLGLQLVSVKDQIDTASPMGKAFFQIACVFAELQRNEIVSRVQLGQQAKRDKGGYAYGRPPYGLDAVGRELVVNEKEQIVLAAIRMWRANGVTCKRIARRLNAEGVPTKTGVAWSLEVVRRLTGSKIVLPDAHKRIGELFDDKDCGGCCEPWVTCKCEDATERNARREELKAQRAARTEYMKSKRQETGRVVCPQCGEFWEHCMCPGAPAEDASIEKAMQRAGLTAEAQS